MGNDQGSQNRETRRNHNQKNRTGKPKKLSGNRNCYSTSFDKPSDFLSEPERFCRKPWFSSSFQRFCKPWK
uniref:Uncharacterized protein n=1 Tax=Arundo donax TaxID=35708 RepID=A0A0A9DVW2_ARUDO